MKPLSHHKGLLRLIAVTCVAALAFWMIVQRDDIYSFFSDPVVISGSIPEAGREATPIQHANPEAQMEIVIGLKSPDEVGLDALIARQQDPSSPDYQRFLNVDEFTARFAPKQSQVDYVTRYLTSSGITVKRVYSNRLLIHAVGTVAQLEKAFNVTINEYKRPAVAPSFSGVFGSPGSGAGSSSSGTYLSNDRDPSIPAGLKNIVLSVIGLNTLAEFQSHAMLPHGAPPHAALQPPLSPRDIATAYDFPNDSNKNVPVKNYNGKGVTLAIATARGYDRTDIETYWKTHGITRTGTLTDIPINGVSNKLEGETTLDLELAGAQAPAANIDMYIASTPAFLNFTLTFAQVVVDNKADVMTVSWGACEERTGWMQMLTEALIFREAAVQGIALFSSAGDDGAYDCGASAKKPMWRVDYPSSSPHVTAVGGTSLHVINNVRTQETTWEGGGGGVSSHWDRPVWQTAPTLPTEPDGNKRVTSDVSLNANPWTGYSFYFQGKWGRIGGTSASAPEWAAFWALVTEATGQRVGSANFYVYKMGGLQEYHKYFYDVTKGNNGAGVGPGYDAGPGWDTPTGWGTPNGTAVINWMIQVSPPKPPREKTLGDQHPGLMFSKLLQWPSRLFGK